jgi:hypothetical protein
MRYLALWHSASRLRRFCFDLPACGIDRVTSILLK